MFSAVRSYQRSIQVAVAVASIPSAAMAGDFGSTDNPADLSILKAQSNLSGQPFEVENHGFVAQTFQVNFPNLTEMNFPPASVDLVHLRKLIENTLESTRLFRLTHPQLRGDLATNNGESWTNELAIMESTGAATNASLYESKARALQEKIRTFAQAVEQYDTAPNTIKDLANRAHELSSKLDPVDRSALLPAWKSFENARAQREAGNSDYIVSLNDAQYNMEQAKETLRARGEEAQVAHRNGLIVLGLTAVTAVIGTACALFGLSALTETSAALPRLLGSRKVSFADRAAYAKAIFCANALSAEIKDVSGRFARIGVIVCNAARLLRQQSKRGTTANFVHGLTEEKPRTAQEVEAFATDLAVRPLIKELLWPANTNSREIAEMYFKEIALPDNPPSSGIGEDNMATEAAQKYTDETAQVMRRGIQLHRGYSSLTIETKSLPDGMPALLSRFGYDITDSKDHTSVSIGRLNAKSPAQFPGPGIVISEPMGSRLFGVPSPGSSYEDVLEPFEKSWPWAKQALRDIEHMQFIFARGVCVMTYLGRDPRYAIGNEPVSYAVFNDHHTGTRADGAHLVSQKAIKRIFEDSIIPLADYTGPSAAYADPTLQGPAEFLRKCREYGITVNLTSGSNIGGALCNGYPSDTAPLHEWEANLRSEKIPVQLDGWGRVHKYYILQRPAPEVSAIGMGIMLQPLAEAHDQAYYVATRYQDCFDVLRLRYAAWKKGFIPRRYGSEFGSDFAERWSIDPQDDGAIFANPGKFLMLDEIFRWNTLGKKANLRGDDFPVLSLGKTFNYFLIPDSGQFRIDSRDLSMWHEGKQVIAPVFGSAVAGRRKELERLWQEFGVNDIPESMDLRLYDRASISR